jgi:hypothetical protein
VFAHDDFVADVAAVYCHDGKKGSFGSGRLVAPNLILTAGHVVDYPNRETASLRGWKVALIRERALDGGWTLPAHQAELIWRGKGDVDLALLQLTDGRPLEPRIKPVFVSYTLIDPLGEIDAAGFPEGWVGETNALRDYFVRGSLRIASQHGPYAWSVPQSDRPDRPQGWRGMSGSAVCRFGPDGKLYLFGAVQDVPANFSEGLLEVARASDAFDDVDFQRHLRVALGEEPSLAPFRLKHGRDDIDALSDILRPIPVTHRVKIQRFVEFYLGTEEQPVPFGGRDSEMDELSSWLSATAAPRRLLITAPAGRGKTALLVNWMQSVPGSWNIVFVPISIRFQTNHATTFYEAMTHQLARIADEKAGTSQHDAAEFYKDRCLELLFTISQRRIQTLVIVDGLDEASGWEIDRTLLQSASNSTVRVIASARTLAGDEGEFEGWLSRLEWQRDRRSTLCLTVPPLSRTGIGAALESMGYPVGNLPSWLELLKSLERLSEGDPLLVRMYAESLWSTAKFSERIEPQQLEILDPGYAGFFRDWFSKQSGTWSDPDSTMRRRLEAVLAVLAVALGPIAHRSLEAVCGTYLNDKHFTLSTADIKYIDRFIIGDGIEIGYSFQHPKFAQYFKGSYFKNGRSIYGAEIAVTLWCSSIVSEVNSGILVAKEVPAYVLHHYVAHLLPMTDRTHAMEQLLADGWHRAWLEQDGGYVRYEMDIKVIMGAFRDATALNAESRFILRLQCALILSSIRALGTGTPVSLLIRLVSAGRLSSRQALHRLRLKDDRELSDGLPKLFDVADAQLQSIILEVADTLSEHERVRALMKLSTRLIEPRRTELFERALTIIRRAQNGWAKADLLPVLVACRPDFIQEARTIASTIDDLSLKIIALIDIANQFPEHIEVEIFSDVLDLAENLKLKDDKHLEYLTYEAIRKLASYTPINFIDPVLTFAEKAANDVVKAEILLQIAPKLLHMDVWNRVIHLANEINGHRRRAMTLVVLIEFAPKEFLSQIVDYIREISDNSSKLVALGCILDFLTEEDRNDVLEQALGSVVEMGSETGVETLVERFASRVPEGSFPRLLGICESISEGGASIATSLLKGVASRLPPDLLGRALSIAENLDRSTALIALLKSIPPDLSERGLSVINKLTSHFDRTRVFESIAETLPDRVLEGALRCTEGVGDVFSQSIALCALTSLLKSPMREELLESAITISTSECTDIDKTQAVFYLGKYLSSEHAPRLLSVVESIKDPDSKADLMLVMASSLMKDNPQQFVEPLLAISDRIKRPQQKIAVLAFAAKHVSEPRSSRLLEVAVEIVEHIGDEWERYGAIRSLIEVVPTALTHRLQRLVEAMVDGTVKSRGLILIARYCSEPNRAELLMGALKITEAESEYTKAENLCQMLELASGDLLLQIEKDLDEMPSVGSKARALITIAPRLSETHQSKVVDSVLKLCSQAERIIVSPINSAVLRLPEARRSYVMGQLLVIAEKFGSGQRDELDMDISISSHGIWTEYQEQEEWINEGKDIASLDGLSKDSVQRIKSYINGRGASYGMFREAVRGTRLAKLINLRAKCRDDEWAHEVPEYLASMGRSGALQLLAMT